MSLCKGAFSTASSSHDGTDLGVRRYLSASGEHEALRVLQAQLCHRQRVTSDDVRLAVREVASKGGTIPIPPDFPPCRWILEFKRLHGFVQLHSFTFNVATASSMGVAHAARSRSSKQQERKPLPLVEPGSQTREGCASSSDASNSSASPSGSDDARDERPSHETPPRSLLLMLSKTAVAYSGPRPPFYNEAQRQVQLQHSFSQRHRQQILQQQRRAMIVDGRRRAAAWPMSASESATKLEKMRLSPRDDSDTGSPTELSLESSSTLLPSGRHETISNGSWTDEMLDAASTAFAYSKKRGYKLSHTVPAETWEKAIAAVEQQGMSLRAAAKMFGVHFAALHRRIKKRAQGGQANGNDGYFNASDEAGIMRVVVAHAELGVLMTFDELMRLVEAFALRKLPDLSVDAARKLLTRFQSRNAQSIRHLIEDWPLPLTPLTASSKVSVHRQPQPYLEHPGFRFGSPTSLLDATSGAGGALPEAPSSLSTSKLGATAFIRPVVSTANGS